MFKIGDTVRIRTAPANGVVDGTNLAHTPPRFLVRYQRDDTGADYLDWFDEADLVSTDTPLGGTEAAGGEAAGATAAAVEAAIDSGADSAAAGGEA